jgi:hypothetical protein
MKLGALLLVLVVACTSSKDDYPIGTGGGGFGGGGGGGGGGDGGTIDGPSEQKRVCVLVNNDPLAPGCTDNGQQNIQVSLGPNLVGTTIANGTYTLTSNVESGSNQQWRLTGGDIVGTIIPFVTDVFTFPALTTQGLADLKAAVPNSGSIGAADVFIHVYDPDGTNAAGVSATAVPNVAVPIYDAGAAWGTGTTTGNSGYIWFPAIAAGAFTVTLTKGTSNVTLYDVHAETNFVTFQTAQLTTFTQ